MTFLKRLQFFIFLLFISTGTVFAQATDDTHSVTLLDGYPLDLAVRGQYAYVTVVGIDTSSGNQSGLRVIDISDPANPVQAGLLDFTTNGAYGQDIDISGNRAYIAARMGGVQIVDISDPTNPTFLGYVDTTTLESHPTAQGVKVINNIAYITNYFDLIIADVSDPANPHILSIYDTPHVAQDLDVRGGVAYVGDTAAGVQVISVGNPSNPQLLGVYDTPGVAVDADLRGNRLYVSDGFGGMHILNIHNPVNPVLLGTYDNLPIGSVRNTTISCGTAFLAAHYGDLITVDVRSPANPQYIRNYEHSGPLSVVVNVKVVGDYAFIAALDGNFRVFDISDSLNCNLMPMPIGGAIPLLATQKALEGTGLSDEMVDPKMIKNLDADLRKQGKVMMITPR